MPRASTPVSTTELVQRLVTTQRRDPPSAEVHVDVLGAERERRLLAQALQTDARVKNARRAFERLLEAIHVSRGLEITDDVFWQRLEAVENALFD